MKNLLIAALVAGSALFVGVAPAEAGNHYRSYNNHHRSYNNHCAPKVYKLKTYEINRHCVRKVRYDHCGKAFYYNVTIVTYKDVYSNGSHRTWTRTFS